MGIVLYANIRVNNAMGVATAKTVISRSIQLLEMGSVILAQLEIAKAVLFSTIVMSAYQNILRIMAAVLLDAVFPSVQVAMRVNLVRSAFLAIIIPPIHPNVNHVMVHLSACNA
jgi:hypothetical protein